MYSALPIVAVALALSTIPYVVLLVGRRMLVARRERRRDELEGRIQPLALELVEGDTDLDRIRELTAAEGEALASVLGRYARLLSGDSRSKITAYFEAEGLVDRQLAILRSRRGWRRAQAARLLGHIGATRAVPALLEALRDRHADVRSTAARSLGGLGAREAVEPVLEAVAARRIPVATAGWTLLQIGPASLGRLTVGGAADDLEARRLAIEMVARLGTPEQAPMLTAALGDPEPDLRAKACRALGRIAAEDELQSLRQMLADPAAAVRAAAASGIGMTGDRLAIDALLRAASRDPDFGAARAAARALARIDPDLVRSVADRTGGEHVVEAADRLAAGVL